jgi:hypothetical protein
VGFGQKQSEVERYHDPRQNRWRKANKALMSSASEVLPIIFHNDVAWGEPSIHGEPARFKDGSHRLDHLWIAAQHEA